MSPSAARRRRQPVRRCASCEATAPIRSAAWAGWTTPGKRYGLELYAQAYNALNHFNALNFSGVVGSPFFGQPTSAAAPRRVELGARLNF